VEGIFWITAVSFFISIGLLLMLPVVGGVRREAQTSILLELIEGLKYVHHNVVLRSLLAVAFVCIVFGLPYGNLMPDFAKKVFDVGEVGYGFLLSAPAVGALVVSLVVASLGDFKLLSGAGLSHCRGRRQRWLFFAEQYADANHSSTHYVR
jgi:hypothetical protein